jgi:hypothetical protein
VPRSPSPAIAPHHLAALATAEHLDLDKLLSRLGAAGVTQLGIDGAPERPERITYRGPRYRGHVALDYSLDAPLTVALSRLAKEVQLVDLYVRLRLAAADMAAVSVAATQLAQYRHRPGSPEPVTHNPFAIVEEVLEAGLVVVYARSFTGHAQLPRSFWSTSDDDRDLHEQLMMARSAIHAHADHTAYRSIVNTTAMLGMEAEPSLSVAHTQMPAETLRKIAALCDRQLARLDAEAKTIYPRLRRHLVAGDDAMRAG